MEKEVKEYLKEFEIEFQAYQHPPVYTCDEASKYASEIRGIKSKNLLIKGKSSFYLAVIPDKDKFNFKQISRILKDELVLASEQELKQVLNLEPGAVSPFALINQSEEVILLISEQVWNSDYVSFHPNINTETLEISKTGFHKFVSSLGNKFYLI